MLRSILTGSLFVVVALGAAIPDSELYKWISSPYTDKSTVASRSQAHEADAILERAAVNDVLVGYGVCTHR
jgi:hypothetical protein